VDIGSLAWAADTLWSVAEECSDLERRWDSEDDPLLPAVFRLVDDVACYRKDLMVEIEGAAKKAARITQKEGASASAQIKSLTAERDEARVLARDLWTGIPTEVKVQMFDSRGGWLPPWLRPEA